METNHLEFSYPGLGMLCLLDIMNATNAPVFESLQLQVKPIRHRMLRGRGVERLYAADGRPLPGVPPVVQDMSVQITAGSRCLLIGPNGAGKTTLLKVLGGKHMVPQGSVKVLGQPPFHSVELTSSGDLSYLGGTWTRDIAFAGYSIPLQARTHYPFALYKGTSFSSIQRLFLPAPLFTVIMLDFNYHSLEECRP